MEISITLIIIIITSITSFAAFSNQDLMNTLIFYPPAVSKQKEWWRFFSCGLVHADIPHLVFNMFALYIFGEGESMGPGLRKSGLEFDFIEIFGNKGKALYLGMYVLALGICLIPTFKKNINNYYYKSLGASGAVSAVVFAAIFLKPLGYMGMLFIPVFIVSFLFGAIYLGFTYYLDKRGDSNINHSAHMWGSLFGVVYFYFACLLFSNYPALSMFIEQLKGFSLSQIFRLG